MTVVTERGTMPRCSASSQRALLGRGEAERGQPLGLGPAEPPGMPLEQVRELDRVLVLHERNATRRQAHNEEGNYCELSSV
jgi:hypothetical protein